MRNPFCFFRKNFFVPCTGRPFSRAHYSGFAYLLGQTAIVGKRPRAGLWATYEFLKKIFLFRAQVGHFV